MAERADPFVDAVGVGLAVPNLPLICRPLLRSDGAGPPRLFVTGERTFEIAIQRQGPRKNHRVLDRHRSTLPKKGKHRVCRVSEQYDATRTPRRLRSLFAKAGLADIEADTVRHTFMLPSFDDYYGPFERGGASTGQALAALPLETRRAVREEVRRELADGGGPVEAEAEYLIVSARR